MAMSTMSKSIRYLIMFGLGLATVFFWPLNVSAANLVVMESKVSGYKVGQSLDASVTMTLKPGESLVLIASDGKVYKLSGPYSGPPIPRGTKPASDSQQALAGMLASRDARTSSVGVFRSLKPVATPMDPWWISLSTPDASRCARAGAKVQLWRQDIRRSENVSVASVRGDAWLTDVQWREGESLLLIAPPVNVSLEAVTLSVMRTGSESKFVLNWIPAGVDDPVILISWMREKGCHSQADALLKQTTSLGPHGR